MVFSCAKKSPYRFHIKIKGFPHLFVYFNVDKLTPLLISCLELFLLAGGDDFFLLFIVGDCVMCKFGFVGGLHSTPAAPHRAGQGVPARVAVTATDVNFPWLIPFLKVLGILKGLAIFAEGKFAPSVSEEVFKSPLSGGSEAATRE